MEVKCLEKWYFNENLFSYMFRCMCLCFFFLFRLFRPICTRTHPIIIHVSIVWIILFHILIPPFSLYLFLYLFLLLRSRCVCIAETWARFVFSLRYNFALTLKLNNNTNNRRHFNVATLSLAQYDFIQIFEIRFSYQKLHSKMK